MPEELVDADAATAGLHIALVHAGGCGLPLQLPLHRLDLVDLTEAEVLAINERLDRLHELGAQTEVAGDRSGLDECLPFPGPAHRVVVGEGAGERAGERAALPFGT